MGYLRGFIPWIAFAVLSSFDWRWGAVAGLLAGGFLFVWDRRAGVSWDAGILDVSTVVYVIGLGALARAAPDSPLEPYAGVMSFGWLALTASGALLVGRPFTLGIARRQIPREYGDIPAFLRINVIITTAWAAAFTFIGAAQAIRSRTDAPAWVGVGCHVGRRDPHLRLSRSV
ncbi:hypothetical protein [Streptomyces sp. AK02-01A]|uniref:hypothetical protein n=1 Tax=Streptomyces sp. AK02-01A TaxID=3028648 RepID=UPI0029B65E89|nr:hypothetical protein [Streptomyces sp. AK02-01A]MDX3854200.1 hypothetical protein [Streptomyces sp. AK02-01A]